MEVLWLFAGFLIGTLNGVVTMCLFQINRTDQEKTEDNDVR